jgi:sterol desaturase/sphingolipid hydroxylase (fatty acid hydroxylase superfamily)
MQHTSNHRPGYDAVADLKPLALDWTNAINALTVLLLWLAGGLHDNPMLWYQKCVELVPQILFLHFGSALVFQWMAKACGEQIQTSQHAPIEDVRQEVIQTVFGFGLVLAPLQAWATTNAALGRENAYKSSLTDCVPGFATAWPVPLQALVYAVTLAIGAVLADAYNYWKHRLFHTSALWPWHKYHHSHRNPSALAGYAVSPVFSLATFWPIGLGAVPTVAYYTPMYCTFVGFYLILNHYLHCGYVIWWLEAPLAPLGIMTSAWHNTHHSHGRRVGGFRQGSTTRDQTFGEMTVWWDLICGTHPGALKKL